MNKTDEIIILELISSNKLRNDQRSALRRVLYGDNYLTDGVYMKPTGSTDLYSLVLVRNGRYASLLHEDRRMDDDGYPLAEDTSGWIRIATE